MCQVSLKCVKVACTLQQLSGKVSYWTGAIKDRQFSPIFDLGKLALVYGNCLK